ncbi:hypothetical protein [Leptolyngbya sp. FACHB-17]|uniref:hypothetical protein n=1 Tax=unclassified Leptolyngbya TaxID=2650499 RepID=UPI0016814738|nr:hypothetical protein [Leptolyngbya sp. FACHB-17]MBD2079034.1 hypothetical protein [Leptolyngbya sp. FACHB-17]
MELQQFWLGYEEEGIYRLVQRDIRLNFGKLDRVIGIPNRAHFTHRQLHPHDYGLPQCDRTPFFLQ